MSRTSLLDERMDGWMNDDDDAAIGPLIYFNVTHLDVEFEVLVLLSVLMPFRVTTGVEI